MNRESTNLVWKRSLGADLLACVMTRPAAALLAAPQMALFVGDTVPTADSVFADFTEPTFSGYARQTLDTTPPIVTVENFWLAILWNAIFTSTSPTPYVTASVTGYFLTDAGGAYWGGERFDSAALFTQGGDFLTIDALMLLALAPVAE